MSHYQELISKITPEAWRSELERTSYNYHMRVLWVATVFNPVFALTDYLIIPSHWKLLLSVRLGISFITLVMFMLRKRYGFLSRVNIAVTFLMISFQNAFIFSLIDTDNLLGQNLNYIALLIGAGMFVLWEWMYSVVIILISGVTSAIFILTNPAITVNDFFVHGGLLLIAVCVFMVVLINTRFQLFVKEIKSRLALEQSYEAIERQGKEIGRINENLEAKVMERTRELEKKNAALEEYAFINAHKLRAPVSNILGLMPIIQSLSIPDNEREVIRHLEDSTKQLDDIVRSIAAAIVKGS